MQLWLNHSDALELNEISAVGHSTTEMYQRKCTHPASESEKDEQYVYSM